MVSTQLSEQENFYKLKQTKSESDQSCVFRGNIVGYHKRIFHRRIKNKVEVWLKGNYLNFNLSSRTQLYTNNPYNNLCNIFRISYNSNHIMAMESLSPYLDLFKSHASQYISSFKQYPIWKQALVSSGIMIGTSTFLTLSSYYYCRIRYPSMPKIYSTITGNLNNNNGIIIFIHGWPDFDYLWEKQIEYFSSKNYCCINLELPNFNINRVQNPWGYDLLTVVDAIALKIKKIQNKKKCILFLHDWGASW